MLSVTGASCFPVENRSMRRWLTMIAFLALASPAVAQEWRMAPEYDVLLSSFEI